MSTLPRFLLIAWILDMISVPILKWLWGRRAMHGGIVMGVVLQAATVLAVLATNWGVAPTLRAAALVIGLGWVAEFVGWHTGVPFGHYHYTNRLQPQVGGVPLLIPLAWLMMLPPAWAVASQLTGGHRNLVFVMVSALAFTAWDFFLDPQMVHWDFWVWNQPGKYFGIPWTNFAGWALVSALITTIVRPPPLPTAPLITIYAVTWFLETFGQAFFWGLHGPALVGGISMGLFLVLALW